MKKKLATIVFCMAILLGIGCMAGEKTAYAAPYSNLAITQDGLDVIELIPGVATQVVLPIKSTIEFVSEARFEALLPEDAPFSVEEIDVYHQYGENRYEDDYIGAMDGAYLSFVILTKETAEVGAYEFVLRYRDFVDNDIIIGEGDKEYQQRLTLTGVVTEEKLPAELAITNLEVTGDCTPGGTATATFRVVNTGETMAKSVRLSGDFSSGLLVPDYTEYTRKLGDIKSGEYAEVSLKIKILDNVDQNLVLLPLEITYKDIDGESYTADFNNILYLDVELPQVEEEPIFNEGSLLINNVRQSPAKPKAGEKVTVTFDMENTGERDYTDTKLYIGYVPYEGFEPVKAEPYQYVGTIKAGQKKAVTINLIAGKGMADGMSPLGIEYVYINGNKETISGNATLYVLNVQKAEEQKEPEEEVTVSRPKLMVTDFSTGSDVIKAGETFDFTFQVYNTHSETAAKNIKVTVNSEAFAVTTGSNSFFLSKMAPEESTSITLNLKAGAGTVTGSYPIDIQMEYEYDGIPATEANSGGVVVTETKMLPVKENLRVSLENIMIGDWNAPYVNQPTLLSFSIYNMGKSVLNNVYFTVEGDYSMANGDSFYYGTLQPGYPDYVEMEIVPLAVGETYGTLNVHMEDSNGDEEIYSVELSAYINEFTEMGWDEPGEDFPAGNFPGEPEKSEKPFWKKTSVKKAFFASVVLLSVLIGFLLGRRKNKKGFDKYED